MAHVMVLHQTKLRASFSDKLPGPEAAGIRKSFGTKNDSHISEPYTDLEIELEIDDSHISEPYTELEIDMRQVLVHPACGGSP